MVSALRPRTTPGLSLTALAAGAGATACDGGAVPDVGITEVTLRAQEAVPGDLFAAVPGSAAHGAEFAGAVVDGGAAAILTDAAGAVTIHRKLGDPAPVPVLVHPAPRSVLGEVAAAVGGDEARRSALRGKARGRG